MRINLGSYTVMSGFGWLNIDVINRPELYVFAEQNGFQFVSMDCSRGLPFPNDSVEYIYSSHMIEHITVQEAEVLLASCYRVLKPGGVMRIAVPDLGKISHMYSTGTMKTADEFNEPCKHAKSDAERFWLLLTENHKTAYDWPAMKSLCERAGFKRVALSEYQKGTLVFQEQCRDLFPEISLFVEIAKT